MSQPLEHGATIQVRDPETGRALGVYTLQGQVARGGQGVVYGLEGPRGKLAVLKVPSSQGRIAMEVERRILLKIPAHKNLVRVVGITTVGKIDCPVFSHAYPNPYVRMGSANVKEELARTSWGKAKRLGLPATTTIEMVQELCSALEHVHRNGFVHGDIKPGNILIEIDSNRIHLPNKDYFDAVQRRAYTTILVDFGSTRGTAFLQDHDEEDTKVVPSEFTPLYAPPEAFRTKGRLGPWVDVYQVGLLLYQLLTGRLPYEQLVSNKRVLADLTGELVSLKRAESKGNVLGWSQESIRETPLDDVFFAESYQSQQLRDRFYDDVESLVGRATSHDPKQRPTMSELRGDILRLFEMEPPQRGLKGKSRVSVFNPRWHLRRTNRLARAGKALEEDEPAGIEAEPSGPPIDSWGPTQAVAGSPPQVEEPTRALVRRDDPDATRNSFETVPHPTPEISRKSDPEATRDTFDTGGDPRSKSSPAARGGTRSAPRPSGSDRLPRPSGSDRLPRPSGSDRLPRPSGSDRLPRPSGSDRLPRPSSGHAHETAGRQPAKTSSGRRATQESSGSHNAQGPLSGVRVALVDDDKVALAVLGSALRKRGCRVGTFRDPESALEVVTHDLPDVLILDMQMPGIRGPELVRRLAERLNGLPFPVIVLSSLEKEQALQDAFRAGVSDYLVKPCSEGELAVKLEQALARRSAQPTAEVPIELGGYEVGEEIRRGEVGIVYHAHDRWTESTAGGPFAIKVLRPELVGQAAPLLQLRREINVVAGVDHPSLPRLIKSGLAGGLLYYVSGEVPKRSLGQEVREDGTLGADDLVLLLQDVGGALAHLHAKRLLLGELTPESMGRLEDGRVVISELHCTRKLGPVVREDEPELSRTRYAGPELFEVPPLPDLPSDIYSLGACALELYSGRPAVRARATQRIDVRLHGKGLPEAVVDLLQLMVEPQLAARCTSEGLLGRLSNLVP